MIFITVCSKVISTSLCSCLFLISSYGPPLVQRASYLPQHSSLFGLVAQLIMIIFSLTALTVCLLAQDVFPMVHIVQPIWLMLQNVSKTLVHVQYIHIQFHFHMSLYKINTFMIRKITLESNSSCINLSLPLIIMIMVLLASINENNILSTSYFLVSMETDLVYVRVSSAIFCQRGDRMDDANCTAPGWRGGILPQAFPPCCMNPYVCKTTHSYLIDQ